MIVLDNGDIISGDAAAATVVDYSVYGLDNNILKQMADGQLSDTPATTIYTADSVDVASTIILVNTDSVARAVNLYMKPSGGTARRIIPEDMSLGAGYSLNWSGDKMTVLNTSGQIISSTALPAHRDTHDPNDGSDPLDTAAAAEIASVQAAAEGTSHSLARADHVHAINHGITDNHIVTVDGTPVDGEATVWTANGLNSLSEAEFKAAFNMEAGTDYQGLLTNSAGLLAALDDETGTGVAVFGTNPTLTGATLAGTLAAADNLITRPKIQDYGETVNALGDTGGGSDEIDIEDGNVVTATVSTGEQTFTFANPPASGTAGSFTLILTNGGSQTVNWPASVDWAGGTAPTLTTSGVDILTFTTVDAGTTWYGFAAGLDMS